jgi:hypothetical protein
VSRFLDETPQDYRTLLYLAIMEMETQCLNNNLVPSSCAGLILENLQGPPWMRPGTQEQRTALSKCMGHSRMNIDVQIILRCTSCFSISAERHRWRCKGGLCKSSHSKTSNMYTILNTYYRRLQGPYSATLVRILAEEHI